MKKIYSVLMIAAALTMLWGCSSSDGDDDNNKGGTNNSGDIHGVKVPNAPGWSFTLTTPDGEIEGKPDWEEEYFYDYDNNMTAIVFVSTAFGTQVTENDRMAAIVDGEVRDVCKPVPYYTDEGVNSILCFMLYIPFDSDEEEVELQYYCAQKNQTYIQKEAFNVNEDTVGDDEMFFFFLRPTMVRYVVLPTNIPFTPTENDEMDFFLDGECCGVAKYMEEPNPHKLWLADAYDMKNIGKKASARYYSAATKSIYETEPCFEIGLRLDEEMPDTLKFK